MGKHVNYSGDFTFCLWLYPPFFVSPLAPTVLDANVETAEVTDLYPWMEYQFRIFATNEHGSGEASLPSLKIKTWDARTARSYSYVHVCLSYIGCVVI